MSLGRPHYPNDAGQMLWGAKDLVDALNPKGKEDLKEMEVMIHGTLMGSLDCSLSWEYQDDAVELVMNTFCRVYNKRLDDHEGRQDMLWSYCRDWWNRQLKGGRLENMYGQDDTKKEDTMDQPRRTRGQAAADRVSTNVNSTNSMALNINQAGSAAAGFTHHQQLLGPELLTVPQQLVILFHRVECCWYQVKAQPLNQFEQLKQTLVNDQDVSVVFLLFDFFLTLSLQPDEVGYVSVQLLRQNLGEFTKAIKVLGFNKESAKGVRWSKVDLAIFLSREEQFAMNSNVRGTPAEACIVAGAIVEALDA
ncbi:hypothetical protein C8J56DRAFT_1042969 [Mycena floridula]|nr:hypothetical protein C8J56DRAFT_1042969 [Mycena floridula]